MTRLLPLLLLVCVASAWAASDAEIERSIETVLGQRHPKEKPDWWRALGPTAPRVMIGMYRKNTDDAYRRLRLVEALGWFGDSREALDFLKETAEDGSTPDVLRNGAIRGVGRHQGAQGLDFAAEFLKHPDPQTRLAAAETIRAMDDPRARDRLEGYLKTEKTGWLVAKVRGESIRPTGKLVAVSSSEDRISPEYEGEWRGFWVAPRAGDGALEAREAELTLKIKDLTRLEANLGLRPRQGAALGVAVTEMRARGMRVSGRFGAMAAKPAQGEPVAPQGEWEGELVEEAGARTLLLRNPSVAGGFTFRKVPQKSSSAKPSS